jgi:glycine cleavage system H protein
MPIGGEILAVNTVLEDSPELMNKSPYVDGWLIEVKPDDLGELDSLMTSDAYREMLEGLEE